MKSSGNFSDVFDGEETDFVLDSEIFGGDCLVQQCELSAE